MSRTILAIVAAIMLSAPAAAADKVDDCLKDSDEKTPSSEYTLRFEVHVKNKTSETLIADFYKIPNGERTVQYASKAMAPGQKIGVTEKLPRGTKMLVQTNLTSYDGDSTYAANEFTVAQPSGGGATRYVAGSFDPKVTCDRRWSSDKKHWIINYVVNPK